MANEIVKVSGIADVTAFFDRAVAEFRGQAILDALQAGVKPIELELAVRTPSSGQTVKVTDKLNESQVTVITLDSQLRGGIAQVGFGKNSYIANFVEYGHAMVGHKPKLRKLGVVPEHPFMRPAAAASQDASIEEVVKSVNNSINTLK